jgi:hypothetical protein
MKIGSLKKSQFTRINFKYWIKDYWKEGEQVELPIVRIFPPNRFPNYTLICFDRYNEIEVSRTLPEELGKKLLKEFKFSIKKSTPGTLFLIVEPNGDQRVERFESSSSIYIYDGKSFVLKNKEEIGKEPDEELEDLPF